MGYKADTQTGGKIRTEQPGAPGRHTSRRKDKDRATRAPGRHKSRRKDKDRATRGTRQTQNQEER